MGGFDRSSPAIKNYFRVSAAVCLQSIRLLDSFDAFDYCVMVVDFTTEHRTRRRSMLVINGVGGYTNFVELFELRLSTSR